MNSSLLIIISPNFYCKRSKTHSNTKTLFTLSFFQLLALTATMSLGWLVMRMFLRYTITRCRCLQQVV